MPGNNSEVSSYNGGSSSSAEATITESTSPDGTTHGSITVGAQSNSAPSQTQASSQNVLDSHILGDGDNVKYLITPAPFGGR